MLRTGQLLKGVITQLDEAQNGVLRVQKDMVFVRHVLLQEEVNVRIVKRISKGYTAEVVAITKPSPQRCKVPCGIYERCGSCSMMHMSAEAQRLSKKKMIEELARKEKGITVNVEDVVTMKDPYHYRNKIIVGFSKDRSHKIQAGFYEEFSHHIIPYKRCLLHPEICDEIIQSIVELMGKFRVEPYDEDKKRGLLRHVILRYGETTKQIMVVLVVNSTVFPARKNFVNALLQKHSEITTVIQNVNSRKTSIVLGNEERILYGKGYIEDTLCGNIYRISAKSFYQINHAQTEVLYKMAIGMLQLTGNEIVLDAFCGIGTIGMYASRFVKSVIGVEINKDAIADAKSNATINHIKNIRFVCDDAGKFMSTLATKKEMLDVVIMDPPRSGSSEEFIRSLAQLKPKQVLYISCNPQTQLRDMVMFKKYGYKMEGNMQPVDLFPFTFHIESIVRLSRTK